MAIKELPSLITLTTEYKDGEDTSHNYGHHRYLAQTFTLTQTTSIFRCLFKTHTFHGNLFYHYALHYTDTNGKPTGAPIATTTLSPTGESFYSPGIWRRFDFMTFPTLPAGVYALVASIPDSLDAISYWLRKDGTNAQYLTGKAWQSENSGITWTELTNQDFMFQVWAYPPPPLPPPALAPGNWFIKDLTYRYHCNGFTITATTNVPCHLYMRWTTKQPLIHIVPKLKRGLAIHGDPYFCFTTYDENEQAEAGDTYSHTFVKRPWPVCETRWFYFWGTRITTPIDSTSAIFELHFAIDTKSYYALANNRTIGQSNVNYQTAHDAPAGNIINIHDFPWFHVRVEAALTASYWLYRGYLEFDTSSTSPTSPIAGAFLSILVLEHKYTSSIAYPNIIITKGVQHDPVIPSDYGDQLPYTDIGGQEDIRLLTDGFYNKIDFNDTGLTFIIPGAITKLCLRQEMDINNTNPPLGTNLVRFSSQQAGVQMLPILTLCYPPTP